MNILARFVPKKNRAAFIAATKQRKMHEKYQQLYLVAKTPAQKRIAENGLERAQISHHAAMGRLPIHLQVVGRLKKNDEVTEMIAEAHRKLNRIK